MSINGLSPIRNVSQKSLIARVESSLLDFIRTRNLTAGDLLPSQSDLAKSLGVSSSTLRETLSRLEERGILRMEHGKGTFISRDPDRPETVIDVNLSLSQMIREQGMLPGTRDIAVTIEPLPRAFQDCFNSAGKNRDYLCIRRVRTANEKPFAYSVAYLETRFNDYADILANFYGSLYEFIQTQTDECIYETETIIYSENADTLIANKLAVPAGAPLLVYRQLHKNQSGENLIASCERFSQSYMKLSVRVRQK